MTKVLPCYSLCPLIEQNSFLGITPDVESDTVLVTTNSNIIGRYRISDPKEISSWNSKGSISCSTVYDSFNHHYVTIFNSNEIRKWTSADKSIDKIKKYKFSERLHSLSISPESGKVIVIFEKGQVRHLNDAIDERKNVFSTSWLDDGEKISALEVVSVSNTLIAVLLIEKVDQSYKIIGISVNHSDLIFCIPLEKSNASLCSQSIVADKNCYFVSLWSDGKIYRDCVYPNTVSIPSNNIAVIDDINLERAVVMKALSPYNVAICGFRNEGLLLIVFSLKFNSIQCKQFYENCSNSPQLWNVGSKLFLIMGHNLVVVPYEQENRKLSTLIGSNHRVNVDEISLLPESDICRNAFPSLLDKNDDCKIREMLKSLFDIPDSTLLTIIMWSLEDIKSRVDILDIVLNNYCSNFLDVSELRSACSVNQSFFILEHIMDSIARSEYNLKLLKWASLFIDAFYHQYVMSDDKSILDKLDKYCNTLVKEENYINEFMQLASVLSCVQRKKVILSM